MIQKIVQIPFKIVVRRLTGLPCLKFEILAGFDDISRKIERIVHKFNFPLLILCKTAGKNQKSRDFLTENASVRSADRTTHQIPKNLDRS